MKFIPLAVMLAAIPLAGKETLNLQFDQPKEIEIAGTPVGIDGDFTSGKFLVYGEKGISIPAAGLAGNAGTVLYKFKVSDFKKPLMIPRYLLTLRTKGRLNLGLYTFTNNPKLHFAFADGTNKYYYRSDKPLVPDREYRIAFTWDGSRIRVYEDGLLAAEAGQPVAVENLTALNLGPYKDPWYAPAPWADDCLAGELRVWDTALSPEEILAACGGKAVPAAEALPALLTAPKITGPAPQIDGELNDPAWNFASGMVGLIHGKDIYRSWEFPENFFELMWDDRALYLGFAALFPGRVPIISGDVRTAGKEPEVWGDESFEFYLRINGRTYRFAGNVAGGHTEWLDSDAKWDGRWTYKTTLKMRIDDRQLWQGEAAIPWSSLGLDAPPKTPVGFNFCRTWRLPETGTHSSLIEGGNYNAFEKFPELMFKPAVPSVRVLEQNNPNSGKFEQKVRFSSPVPASMNYRIQLAKADGSALPLTLIDKNLSLSGGEVLEELFQIPISQAAYDRLVFTCSGAGGVLMREIMPFRLNEEYVEVNPRFLREQVILTLKQPMLKNKFGHDCELRLTAPDGSEIRRETVAGANEIPVPFARTNPPGTYKVELVNTKSRETVFGRTFHYPGIGEWEKLTFDNRIIPPFTALRTSPGTNSLKAAVWGREYRWDGQLFPAGILSQGRELLAAPVTLMINGKAAPPARLENGKNADHRAEFSAAAENSDCRIASESWIEYDGVQWNQVKIKALKNLKALKLELRMPAALAKYLHTSDSFSWGSKITAPVGDGERIFRFYPAVWLGSEDKGLCFFAESRAGWKSASARTYRLFRDGKEVALQVNLADELKEGEEFAFDFGLLAGPVRPLPENYPLNTFSYHFAAPMNRPGRIPASDIMIASSGADGLGAYFGDLPSPEKSGTAGFLAEKIGEARKFNGRIVPYTCARYLSNEYPEVEAFKNEWKISPDQTLDYVRDGRKYFLYDCCPTTGANAFFMYKFKEMLKRFKPGGIYFDFGAVPFCGNREHGCSQRSPLLAQREFYRRIILCQLDAGIKDPVIVLHNTDHVQLPAATFATHLFNGEQIRQSSTPMLHDGKDILDNYGLEMFACELNSLPFGLTNSIYLPADNLLEQYGGGKEPEELYKFRMTKAVMAGALIHNTVPAMLRCHFGIFDKLIRFYDEFRVPEARFHGYWEHPAKVLKGRDIYVSVYRHASQPRALAVISHVSKSHEDQEIEIEFDAAGLGLPQLNRAVDRMTAPDPDYAVLESRLAEYRVSRTRTPLALGDFGSEILSMHRNVLKMKLKHHSFAIVELTEESVILN